MNRTRLTNRHPEQERYFDVIEDWDLIEASFLKQYGIRLRKEDDDMSWNEFCNLISGLMHDTPLGQIVAIRAEKDQNVIKGFTQEQRRIRNDWIIRRNKKLKENPEKYRKYCEELQRALKTAFS